ncbi:MAG: hypothetical protein NZ480_05500 [Bdellovibrionaceae bacterium]|nr:hypothetical protein [Pseudobdellovibrionaceae bacterium]MDW8190367.1 hypothetical protein [Pseudobdellovibrionaceae bacterium]
MSHSKRLMKYLVGLALIAFFSESSLSSYQPLPGDQVVYRVEEYRDELLKKLVKEYDVIAELTAEDSGNNDDLTVVIRYLENGTVSKVFGDPYSGWYLDVTLGAIIKELACIFDFLLADRPEGTVAEWQMLNMGELGAIEACYYKDPVAKNQMWVNRSIPIYAMAKMIIYDDEAKVYRVYTLKSFKCNPMNNSCLKHN